MTSAPLDPGHLALEDLERVAARQAPVWALLVRLLGHLEAACPDCREAISEFAVSKGPGRPFTRLFAREDLATCRPAFHRSREGLVRMAQGGGPEDDDARKAVEALLVLPPDDRPPRLKADPRLSTAAAWARLVALSLAADSGARGEAEEWAGLALAVASRLDRGELGSALVEDCCAVSAAALARARAHSGETQAARRALDLADRFLAKGTGGPYPSAERKFAAAEVARSAGRLRQAAREFAQAARLYARAGDRRCEGAARLQQAVAWKELGLVRSAARALGEAVARVDPWLDPDLAEVGADLAVTLLPENSEPLGGSAGG